MNLFQLDIVSIEGQIFSGRVQKLFVSGVQGDLELLFGHTPFLTALKPGPTWIVNEKGAEEVFYISGGLLEFHPQNNSTILADAALRAKDLDEKQALEAKQRAEQILGNKVRDFDYANAQSQLIRALAQLQALKKFREKYRS